MMERQNIQTTMDMKGDMFSFIIMTDYLKCIEQTLLIFVKTKMIFLTFKYQLNRVEQLFPLVDLFLGNLKMVI